MRRDRAQALIDAIDGNKAPAMLAEFDKLDVAFRAAQRLADEWRTPAEVFEPLRETGILGVGGPAKAVSTLYRELGGQPVAADIGEAFEYVAGGVKRAVDA